MNYDFYQILYKNGEKVFTDYKHTYEVYLRKNSEGKYTIYFNKGNLAGKKGFISVFKKPLSGFNMPAYDSYEYQYMKFTFYDDNNKSFSRYFANTNTIDPSFNSDSLFYDWLYNFIEQVLSENLYRGKNVITERNT